MKFTLTINQAGATIAGLAGKLDIIDLAIFDAFKDFANGNRCEKKFEQNRVWFWISYQALVKEIPFVPIKTKDAVYRRMKKLAEANIIEFHPGNQKTGKAFFAWSANYDHLNGRDFTEDELKMLRPKPTDEKPYPYGRASVPPTDEKPYNQYTKDQRTKPIEKDMSAQTADGLPEKPSLDANPSEGEKTPSSVLPPAKKAKPDPPPPQPLDLSTCYQHFSDPAKMRALWERWLKYRKDIKKPLKTEDAIVTGLRLLYKWTSGNVATATEIVEKSIGSGYTGLIKPEPPKQPALFQQPAPYKLEPAPERKPIAAYTP